MESTTKKKVKDCFLEHEVSEGLKGCSKIIVLVALSSHSLRGLI